MRTELKVSCRLNRFYYHNDNYDWTTEMPYFWFSFFKIDGSNCHLTEDFQLEGSAAIYSNFKKFKSLSNILPDKKDVIKIPSDLGKQDLTLIPIAVPEFLVQNGFKNMEPYVGCVAVLANEQCALNDEKNNYHQILMQTIQSALDQVIKQTRSAKIEMDDLLVQLKNEIETNILSEAKHNQSFWKRLTTENEVNATIWIFPSDELESIISVSLLKYWGTDGLWELSGKVKVTDPQIKSQRFNEFSLRKKNTQTIH